MKTIAKGLHQVAVGMVNVFLLERADGLVLIDTGFPGSDGAILKAMAQLGYTTERLAHIVLTHAHPDHIGSLAALKRATGAATWTHADDAPLAEQGGMRLVHPSPGLLPALLFRAMSRMPHTIEPASIDHRMSDGEVLQFADLQVIHAPGHCQGQVVLLWPEHRTLIAADSCMHLLSLRVPLVNEDASFARRSLGRIAMLDFDIACFGDGRLIMAGAAGRFRRAFGTAKASWMNGWRGAPLSSRRVSRFSGGERLQPAWAQSWSAYRRTGPRRDCRARCGSSRIRLRRAGREAATAIRNVLHESRVLH